MPSTIKKNRSVSYSLILNIVLLNKTKLIVIRKFLGKRFKQENLFKDIENMYLDFQNDDILFEKPF